MTLEQQAHEMAIAFVTSQFDKTFKFDPNSNFSELEQRIHHFNGLYILSYQHFHHDCDE